MIKKTILCMSATMLSIASVTALAKITPEEVARLDAELTPVGAERVGNAEGTIPEWTGGLTDVPAGWQRGQDRANPFAEEKPLFVITAANMVDHADKLTEGMQALLTQYPEFKMPVYPTHRTAALPQYVYDNIKQYATEAELVEDGNAVANVWGAIPFPIPKNGNEVIWNHNTRYKGTFLDVPRTVETTIYNSGQRLEWVFDNKVHFVYYDPNVTEEEIKEGTIFRYASTMILPSRDSGEGVLALENIDGKNFPRKAWTYDPGERRVRRAPNLAFDTPDRPVNTVDDYDMFSGSPDRYDLKLIGKKEIYVPYNNNDINKTSRSVEEVYGPPVINPDMTRYELHRVWVVEGTVNANSRHIYARRMFYIDEDTWSTLAIDKYDANGNLWRVGLKYPIVAPEVPVTAGGFYVHYDLKVGAYYTLGGAQGQKVAPTFDGEPPKASYYAPAAVRRRGK